MQIPGQSSVKKYDLDEVQNRCNSGIGGSFLRTRSTPELGYKFQSSHHVEKDIIGDYLNNKSKGFKKTLCFAKNEKENTNPKIGGYYSNSRPFDISKMNTKGGVSKNEKLNSKDDDDNDGDGDTINSLMDKLSDDSVNESAIFFNRSDNVSLSSSIIEMNKSTHIDSHKKDLLPLVENTSKNYNPNPRISLSVSKSKFRSSNLTSENLDRKNTDVSSNFKISPPMNIDSTPNVKSTNTRLCIAKNYMEMYKTPSQKINRPNLVYHSDLKNSEGSFQNDTSKSLCSVKKKDVLNYLQLPNKPPMSSSKKLTTSGNPILNLDDSTKQNHTLEAKNQLQESSTKSTGPQKIPCSFQTPSNKEASSKNAVLSSNYSLTKPNQSYIFVNGNEYMKLKLLGKGGSSEVYEVRHFSSVFDDI